MPLFGSGSSVLPGDRRAAFRFPPKCGEDRLARFGDLPTFAMNSPVSGGMLRPFMVGQPTTANGPREPLWPIGLHGARGHDPVQPQAGGQQARESGDYGTVSPARPRTGDLPP